MFYNKIYYVFWLVENNTNYILKEKMYSMSNSCVFQSDNWLTVSLHITILITNLTRIDVEVSWFQTFGSVFKLKVVVLLLVLISASVFKTMAVGFDF